MNSSRTIVFDEQPFAASGRVDYESLSLEDLALRIVQNRDEQAIEESVQRRRIFLWEGKQRMSFAEFLRAHYERACEGGMRGRTIEILDEAYSLTVDKFTSLPREKPEGDESNDDYDESAGDETEDGRDCGEDAVKTDCRNYYNAFLRHIQKNTSKDSSALERETETERSFQRFVNRHFYLSVKEAARKLDPRAHRYTWKKDKVKYALRMPRTQSGAEKRLWLEENINPMWLEKSTAREKIQELINKELLSEHPNLIHGSQAANPLPWSVEYEVTQKGLAGALADEKADGIDNLRRSIKNLGRRKLRKLIHEVVGGIATDDYNEGQVAVAYGLSKSTFSRFCGGYWSSDAIGKPPDLWANLAQLMAREPRFMDAAQSAGIMGQVREVVSARQETEEENDEEIGTEPDEGTANG